VTDGFAWAVLPTWKGRYPRRYLWATAIVLVAAGLVPAIFSSESISWMRPARWVLFGMWVGIAAAILVIGRREVVVTAGVFHASGGLDGVTSSQVLGVVPVVNWWGRRVRIETIGRKPSPVPIVSWRIWPEPAFDDQVSGLRLALGMPADPVSDVH